MVQHTDHLDAKSLTLTGSATGPRNRAPPRFENHKCQSQSSPNPCGSSRDDDLDKANQKSGTARRPKPRVSHAEMTKVGVLGEMDDLEEGDRVHASQA
jgi:hypothetical protein